MRIEYALTHEPSSQNAALHAEMHELYSPGVAKSPKKKPLFAPYQVKVLIETIRKHRKDFRNQSDLAKAIKLTQPALSNLLAGKWKPGMTTALAIAELDGMELRDLIGPLHGAEPPPSGTLPVLSDDERFRNIDVCVKFFGGKKNWSPWTIAAAKAGVYGDEDFASPEWEEKLDKLEKALGNVRRP